MLERFKSSFRVYWPYYLLLGLLLWLFWEIWDGRQRNWHDLKAVIGQVHGKGETARTVDYVHYWLPFMARIHLVLIGALLMVSPWLIGDGNCGAPLLKTDRMPSRGRAWLCVLLVVLSSAILNAPRLDHSLWFDEEATVRRVIVGEVVEQGGGYRIKEPDWTRSLFFFNDPNNHPLFTALAKISHAAFPPPLVPESFSFRERSIRLPGWVFGTLGLGALFWMMQGMGLQRAGILAVVWLALHPWHVRYSIDARGYCLLFALMPLTVGCLWRAVATCGLRWWLGFGLASFLTLWAYAGSLYFILALNLAALGMIFLARGDRPRMLGRYVAANTIGAALTSLVYGPCWQSMSAYLKRDRSLGDITWDTVSEAGSGLFTGIPLMQWEPHELALSLVRLWQQQRVLVIAVAVLLGVVFLAGLVALWRRGGRARLLYLPVLLPIPLLLLVSILKHNIIHPFYFVPGLPMLALVMGCGVDLLSRHLASQGLGRAVTFVLVGAFGAFTWRQNSILRHYPIEPMRESVEVMRKERHPELGNLKSVLTAHVNFLPKVYDPAGVQITDRPGLERLISRSRAENLPLFVNLSDLRFARMRHPDVVALLEDDSLFDARADFPGTDRQPSRVVYRLKSGTFNSVSQTRPD